LKNLNKKLSTNFTADQFKRYNQDFIININNDDLEYEKDLSALNNVFVSKLYKKDNTFICITVFSIIIIILNVITLSSVSGLSTTLMQLIEQLNKVLG